MSVELLEREVEGEDSLHLDGHTREFSGFEDPLTGGLYRSVSQQWVPTDHGGVDHSPLFRDGNLNLNRTRGPRRLGDRRILRLNATERTPLQHST